MDHHSVISSSSSPLHHHLVLQRSNHALSTLDYLVAPFLNTRGILTLSQSTKCLLRFRGYVRETKLIVPQQSSVFSSHHHHDAAAAPYGGGAMAEDDIVVVPSPSSHQQQGEGGSSQALGGTTTITMTERAISLLSSFHSLQVLKLEEIRDIKIISQIAETLEKQPRSCFPHLKTLIISAHSSSQFGNRGAAAVAAAIRSGGLKELERVVLRKTSIGPCGMIQLAQALHPTAKGGACPVLRSLDLSHQNLIGNQGAKALADAMKEGGCRHLTALRLCSNSIGETGLMHLSQAFAMGGCPSLEHLTLTLNHIRGEVGIVALAAAFLYLPHLRHLDLSRNEVGVIGCQALAKAFLDQAACPRLSYLGLTHCLVRDEGASSLFQALEEGGLPSLEALDMTGNDLSDAAGPSLVEALRSQRLLSLTVLIMSNNHLTWMIAKEIVKALSEGCCPSFRHLNLWINPLPKPTTFVKGVRVRLNSLEERGLREKGIEVFY